VFGTLLGALPRPPLAADATRDAILDAVVAAQAEAGLEPITDGGWPLVPGDPVASWRATAARTERAVKAVLPGPYTSGIAAGGPVESLRDQVRALMDAGCPMIEMAEPGAVEIGTDEAERARFRDLHERLLAGLADTGQDGVSRVAHLSLAITGGAADAAGPATILGPAYDSLAVDLIAGPDNWRLVTATPGQRGIVCGVVSAMEGSDDRPELPLWAAGYAASSGGRGPARVGVATASSLAGLSWAVATAKLASLAEVVRLAALPPDERLAALDPRAIDSRSAALGRYVPARARKPRCRPRG
jgi:methionine synthase II (cobalamin-independent)